MSLPTDHLDPSDSDTTLTPPSLADLDVLFDPHAQMAPVADPDIAIAADPDHDIAALYVKGSLVFGGTHDEVNRRALAEAGIELIESASFLLGTTSTSAEHVAFDAAATLSLVREYERTTTQAASMREQAERLLAQATELEERLNARVAAAPKHAEAAERPLADPPTDSRGPGSD